MRPRLRLSLWRGQLARGLRLLGLPDPEDAPNNRVDVVDDGRAQHRGLHQYDDYYSRPGDMPTDSKKRPRPIKGLPEAHPPNHHAAAAGAGG
jgi:hypothetical protein